MSSDYKPITILLADDDPDDRLLVREAFEENSLMNSLETVQDGEELMDFLYRRGKFVNSTITPGLILLDLNMPRKSGMEALREIKADSRLRHVPVIILTTSRNEDDIVRAYECGVNSFVVKPVTFESLVALVHEIDRYWFQIVQLPKFAN